MKNYFASKNTGKAQEGELTSAHVVDVLCKLADARSGKQILGRSAISGIVIRDGKVGCVIELPPGVSSAFAEEVRRRGEQALLRLPGVKQATVAVTAEHAGGDLATTPGAREGVRAVWQSAPLPGVKRVIAVASGKGGVGKSTTTVNLARALKAQGLQVAILDADIYGPSLPRMVGISGQPEVRDGQLLPMMAEGMPCMSMGFITPNEGPVVWRGSMATKALQQMLRGVAWNKASGAGNAIDVLLVDMPPGTGDIHLSLAQAVPLDGAIIISTPQEVALLDAMKCLQMFRKVNVKVLGIIENMSYFIDPTTGNRSDIFGHGGAKKAAEEYGAPFLGEVPLDMRIRQASDTGKALTGGEDQGAAAWYEAIAKSLKAQFS